MTKSYTSCRKNTGGQRSLVTVGGIAVTAALFLALPLTQLIDPPDEPTEVEPAKDFALAVPDFDIMEQPPPKPEDKKPPPPDYVPPIMEIPLGDIEAMIEGIVGDWGPGRLIGDFRPVIGMDIFETVELDELPVPIHRVAPNYPYEKKRAGIDGPVRLVFVVDENGRVRDVRFERSSDRGFEQSSVNALREWRFEPGRVEGRAVRTRMKIPLKFSIR